MSCDHQADRVHSDSCVKCGHVLPPWHLTEAYARAFYEAIGINGHAEQALDRLRQGGRDYGWQSFLEKRNAAEAVEELLDAGHYALFDTLLSFKLEAEGLEPADAEAARAHLGRAGGLITAAIAEFDEAARRLKK